MDTSSPTSKLAKLAITSYLVHPARKRKVEQICFFWVQHRVKSCLISKNLRDVAKLLVNI